MLTLFGTGASTNERGDAVRGFRRALEEGRFVITGEVLPPVSGDPDQLRHLARPLRGLADAVNVTDAAGARTQMSALAAAAILAQDGIEPILQLTCRDRNRIALQGDLLGAAALGITNFLCLRGDDPSAGDQPEARAVFDLNSSELLQTAVGIRDRGALPSGRKVDGHVEFFLGAADTPIDPQSGWTPDGLAQKADAGAQFVQTQFCMDLGIVRRYVQRLADAGLTTRLHVLIGLAPLASAGSARWMRKHLFGTIIPDQLISRMEQASDPKAEGRQICLELLHGLTEIPGVAGAHIMAPLNEAVVPGIIAEFHSATRRARVNAPPP
jgi:methylenetetrahydrofolate reductase (NADPH)